MQEKISLTPAQTGIVDGVRALAVLAVVALHWKNVLLGAGGLVALVTTPGAGGVIVFFVVSGFCITLSKRATESWLSFYLRRLFRILPACWFMLAGYLIAVKWGWGKTISFPAAWASFAILPNWFGGATIADWPKPAAELNPVLWSLQTELELYVLFPLSLWLFQLVSRRVFLGITFAVTLASWAGWVLTREHFSYFPPLPSVCHWSIWNLGLLLCFRAPAGKLAGTGTLVLALLAMGAGAVLLLLRNGWHTNALSGWYFFTGIGAYFFLQWALVTQPGWLRHPFMVYVGKRSYSFYLLHWPVVIVGTLLVDSKAGAGLFALVALVVISEISYRWVELPFIRIGKQLAGRIDSRRNASMAPPLLASHRG